MQVMALALEHFHGPHPDTVLRAQRAFLALNEIDRVILTGSGGNLHPFLPLDPFHGIHRAYAWQGVGRPHFVEVSASARRHSNGDYEWTWPVQQVHSFDRVIMRAVTETQSQARFRIPRGPSHRERCVKSPISLRHAGIHSTGLPRHLMGMTAFGAIGWHSRTCGRNWRHRSRTALSLHLSGTNRRETRESSMKNSSPPT